MILGTAGHIDHGKTALVRALTGIDTDRLPEEKRRGITIELGFAPLLIDGMPPIGVVDVPGHEAFVRTMLAGATGIDLALVVIAADEGIMPQTREHLAILELLGVKAGAVALTKCDLVEADWAQLVEADVRKFIEGTGLAAAPIIHCSALTGSGVDQLKLAIAAAARAVPGHAADDLFRMPIDRAFSVKGTGTVVTGTIWSGTLVADEAVLLLPRGLEARVRGVERHGKSVAEVTAGARAAIALSGVDRDEIDVHGTVVVRAGDGWVATSVFRADLELNAGAPRIGPRTRVRFHLGTADVAARLVASGGAVTSGTRLSVRIATDSPVVARAGDRFVIRTTSPAATIGGGLITDADTPKRRAKPWPSPSATDAQRLAWMLAEPGGKGISVSSLPIRIGVLPSGVPKLLKSTKGATRVGDRLFDETIAKLVERDVLSRVDEVHRTQPLEPGLPAHALRSALRSALRAAPELVDAVIALLVSRRAIVVTSGVVARLDWKAGGDAADSKRTDAVLAAIRAAGDTPGSVEELAAVYGKDVLLVLKHLARRGDLVQVAQDRFYAAEAAATMVKTIRTAVGVGNGLTASQLRDTTGLTRKYLIPFLEHCDRLGVTIRRGDLRIPGPHQDT